MALNSCCIFVDYGASSDGMNMDWSLKTCSNQYIMIYIIEVNKVCFFFLVLQFLLLAWVVFLSDVFRFVSCASASVAFAKGSCNVFVSRYINIKLPK